MSTTKATNIDFSHRLTRSYDNSLGTSALCDTVGVMTERALSVLSAMGELAVNNNMDALPASAWHCLFDTVSNELRDIDAVMALLNHADNAKERG